MKTTTTLSFAAAAMAGLLAGSAARATTVAPAAPFTGASLVMSSGAQSASVNPLLGARAPSTLADVAKHDCKGKNDCKGQGGCKTGDMGCKGKNSCKGMGGCKTTAIPSLQANQARLGTLATRVADAKHDCKGMNDCKGQGGCKTGDMGCKSKNSCKGKGGCSTK